MSQLHIDDVDDDEEANQEHTKTAHMKWTKNYK